ISLVGPRGHTIAKVRPKLAFAANSIESNQEQLVEAVADTAQLGWKVAAQIPERAAARHMEGNWITFVALSSLLAVASFASATWLTRNTSGDRNAGTPAPSSSPTKQAANRTAGMTLPFNSQGAEPQSRELGEQRLRQALSAGDVGVWEWNLETGNIHWDSEISEIFSDLHHAHNRPARKLLRRVERHDRRRLLKAIGAAIAGQKPLAVEVRIRGRNRDTRWIAVRGAPTETMGRKVTALAGVAYDVTDQKLSLTRTDALLREVSHRSKNLLALILAMARLTARDAVDVKSHLKDFTLRVAGLSASQDLIVASDWQSVDFATLAAAEIGAVARTDADRVAIMGPPVMLTPEAAQTLGMVLTELALNAVEHGALSAATGEVKLEWTLPDPTTILISWRETGGPPFLTDGPKGYGMSVVERFSTQGLKLSARADGNAEEFTWTLTGPLANVGHAQKAAIKT
ncbi:MAG: PAS domain-containing protein, partial [Hyphomicrobium sp.]|nr:PAS domain-containing protein [Hyphomicrobium sp.]